MLSLKDSILIQHAKGMSLHLGYFDTASSGLLLLRKWSQTARSSLGNLFTDSQTIPLPCQEDPARLPPLPLHSRPRHTAPPQKKFRDPSAPVPILPVIKRKGRCVKMCDFNDVGTSLCDVKPERQHIGPTCQRHVPTFRLF